MKSLKKPKLGWCGLLVLGLFTSIVLICSQRLDVSEVRLISEEIAWAAPAFSPDGNLIAYGFENTIKIIDLNGQEQAEFLVQDQPLYLQWLTASQVIYIRWIGDAATDGVQSQFCILNIQSGEISLASDVILMGRLDYFALSPSKTRLAFVKQLDEGIPGSPQKMVHTLDLATGVITPLITPVMGHCNSPIWNNESELLSICSDKEPDKMDTWSSQVWYINVITGESEPVADPKNHFSLSESPDGHWLIYLCPKETRPPSSNLCVAPTWNGKPVFWLNHRLNLSSNLWVNLLERNFFELPPSYVAWSPDSKHITFSGDLRTSNGFEKGIWYVTFDN